MGSVKPGSSILIHAGREALHSIGALGDLTNTPCFDGDVSCGEC